MGDERVVALATDRPVVGAAGQRALEPRAVQLDRDLGAARGALEASLLGRREGGRAGGHEFVEEDRQFGRGLDLDPLPQPDLGDGRAGLRLFEVGRGRLEPPGDGDQAFGQRRVVAREEEEEAVPDRVDRERPSLPDAQDLRVEDRPTEVVELEIALESGGRRQRIGVDRLDLRQVCPIAGDLGEQRLTAAVPELVVRVVDAQPGGEHGILLHPAPEARLDQVVEARVGRAGRRPAFGTRERAVVDEALVGHGGPLLRAARVTAVRGDADGRWAMVRPVSGREAGSVDQAEAPTGSGATGRGSVSARAARVAAMVDSMSSAVTP